MLLTKLDILIHGEFFFMVNRPRRQNNITVYILYKDMSTCHSSRVANEACVTLFNTWWYFDQNRFYN